MARSRGRNRKSGQRHPSGELAREPRQILPDEAAVKRAKLMGKDTPLSARCTPLRVLESRRSISTRHLDAGEKYRDLWVRWSMVMGLPSRHPVSRDPTGPGETDPMGYEAIKHANDLAATIRSAETVMLQSGPKALVRELLDGVVLEGWPGEDVFRIHGGAMDTLRAALDRLADYFRVPMARAA